MATVRPLMRGSRASQWLPNEPDETRTIFTEIRHPYNPQHVSRAILPKQSLRISRDTFSAHLKESLRMGRDFVSESSQSTETKSQRDWAGIASNISSMNSTEFDRDTIAKGLGKHRTKYFINQFDR